MSGDSELEGSGSEVPLRVLSVMPGVSSEAGAERSLVAMAPLLSGLGIDLQLVVLTERQNLVCELEAVGLPVHDLSGSSSPLRRMRSLRRTIQVAKPDLLHATLFEATQLTILASSRLGIPCVVTWANTLYTPEAGQGIRWGTAKYALFRRWEMLLNSMGDTRFHAVTQGVAQYNQRRLNVAPQRVRVGERGRDADRLIAGPDARRQIREELGIPMEGRLVLAVGRQDHQKAHDRLVRLFDRHPDRYPNDRLAIVGRPGSGTPALDAALAELGHPVGVLRLGHRDDVPDLLAAADAIVCTSWREGAAGALLEAMAAGVPIVSVPLDGLQGVLTHDLNAMVAPIDRFGAALAEVLDDTDLAKRLTDTARAEFDARFTAEMSAEQMADVLRWAAGADGGDGSGGP